jgi:hypothetical protein
VHTRMRDPVPSRKHDRAVAWPTNQTGRAPYATDRPDVKGPAGGLFCRPCRPARAGPTGPSSSARSPTSPAGPGADARPAPAAWPASPPISSPAPERSTGPGSRPSASATTTTAGRCQPHEQPRASDPGPPGPTPAAPAPRTTGPGPPPATAPETRSQAVPGQPLLQRRPSPRAPRALDVRLRLCFMVQPRGPGTSGMRPRTMRGVLAPDCDIFTATSAPSVGSRQGGRRGSCRRPFRRRYRTISTKRTQTL